jgi:ABC-type nitrate/sulfonate/bicarbonate transport system substrate-binding protein
LTRPAVNNNSNANPRRGGRGATIRVGFVPLIDAAPLIAAEQLGYFAAEGLHVSLERQIGWANVRDKLAYGHLDASHALLGLPLARGLSADSSPQVHGEELIAVMSLSEGGNAITLSRELADAGVNSAATLSRWVHDRHNEHTPNFAHVFASSMHHYLLRDWLEGAGVNPDLDTHLRVIPPPQMVQHLADGNLDGFCVGEPWNTLAEREGVGRIVALTSDIVPAHPEKVLATSRRWAANHAAALKSLIRATLRACAWCNDPANSGELAEVLSESKYIGLDADLLRRSLSLDRTFGLCNARLASHRPPDWKMRSFAAADTFPSRTHMAWLLEQMVRWGHAPSDTDVIATADRCTDSTAYRAAASTLNVACPNDEYPPMRLRGGRWFDAGLRTIQDANQLTNATT